MDIIIESDSKAVVEWFRTGKVSLWYLWDFWDDLISEMEGLNVRVIHQFREVKPCGRLSCEARGIG